MTKKYFALAVVAAVELVAVLCILVYVLYFLPGTTTVYRITGKVPESTATSNSMIKADVRISGRTVAVTEEITFNKSISDIFLYIPSANLSVTTISKVTAEGSYRDEVVDGTNLIITCEKPQDKIILEYEIFLENRQTTLSWSDGRILLTNFLITPAVYRDDIPIRTYRWSYGDPYIYGINDYILTITMDKDYHIFAPGQKSDVVRDGMRVAVFEAENLRDFPAALLKNANVKTQKNGDALFYFIDSDRAAEYVNASFEFARDNIGPYPYKEFFIVKTPLLHEGMEFSTMIFLSDKCFDNIETLKRVTYHEVFHQWFYGVMGTDQINEPFMDEGLVNYLSMLLCQDAFSISFSDSFLSMSLKDYPSREMYYSLAYNNSVLYFHNVHTRLGDGFFEKLRELYTQKKFQMLYYDDFTRAMQ